MPRDLPISNGRLYVAFDETYGIRDLCFPHVGQENHVMGRRCRIGVQVDGRSTWVGGDGWESDLRYESGALVTRVTLTHEDLGLVVRCRDAVDPEQPILLRSITLSDTSGEERDVTVWLHHDLQIGEADAFCCVSWDPACRAMYHHKRDRWFLTSLATDHGRGPDLWTCDARSSRDGRGCAGKIEDLEPCDHNPVSIGDVDAAVGTTLRLDARGTRRLSAFVVAGRDRGEVLEGRRRVLTVGVEGLLERTLAEHRDRSARLTEGMTHLGEALTEAATRSAFIVEAHADQGGAVSAAVDSDVLVPGRESYAYCWPRDGALAVHALDRVGIHGPSERFFRFCARALEPEGWLGHRYWADGTPGSSWLPRTQAGLMTPPIQEDETALVLWSLGEHVRRTDSDLAGELFEHLIRPAAAFLESYRDPQTRLPLPSWDLWEERFGVHAFTVGAVARGLEESAFMAERTGHAGLAEAWRRAAGEVHQGLDRYLFHEDLGRYARCGNRDDRGGYWLDTTVDASLCWLLLLGARATDSHRMISTLDAVRERLRVRTPTGGIARYENDPFLRVGGDPEEVPGNPWIICTLALAECDWIMADSADDRAAAEDELRSVLRFARPSGVLPEQVDPFSGAPIGAGPLAWSHAMMLGALARCRATPAPAN